MFNSFSENRAVYEIILKSVVDCRWQYDGPLHAGLVRLLARNHARTHTHREICNAYFPRKQWFGERASMLRYTNIVCLVSVEYFSRGYTVFHTQP